MEASGLIPDVINKAPPLQLEVVYPGGEMVQMGNELTPTQVKDQPKVTWSASPGKYYTLLMLDPDAPSRKMPVLRSVNPGSESASIRNRIRFNAKQFVHKYAAIGDPVAGNYFQAQWDAYVDVRNKGRCAIL